MFVTTFCKSHFWAQEATYFQAELQRLWDLGLGLMFLLIQKLREQTVLHRGALSPLGPWPNHLRGSIAPEAAFPRMFADIRDINKFYVKP